MLEIWSAPDMWILAVEMSVCGFFWKLKVFGSFLEIWKSLNWEDFHVSSILDSFPVPEVCPQFRGTCKQSFLRKEFCTCSRMSFIHMDFVEPCYYLKVFPGVGTRPIMTMGLIFLVFCHLLVSDCSLKAHSVMQKTYLTVDYNFYL